jgi:predicted Zn finger-like uncharacterized protein
MFKVVADQLKVSDGWVRCGHCDGVFDASAHFQAIDEAEPLPVPEPDDQGAPPLAALPIASVDDSPEDFIAQINPPGWTPAPIAAHFVAHAHEDDASVSAPLSNYLSAPESADFPAHDDHARHQEGVERRALYGAEKSSKPLNSAKSEDARRPVLPEVTFVQGAQRRDTPKNPLYKLLAVLFALVLLGSLALQVLLHERDALAARYPALLPVLDVVCQTIDCQINPPRVIEAITIDSSSFTQTGPDAYRLNVVLKNTRSAVVAMPTLEVTLTGSQNEVLIRKVLLPDDIGATSNRLDQATPFAGVFNLLVSLPKVPVAPVPQAPTAEASTSNGPPVVELLATSASVTGYRLFAFYP